MRFILTPENIITDRPKLLEDFGQPYYIFFLTRRLFLLNEEKLSYFNISYLVLREISR